MNYGRRFMTLCRRQGSRPSPRKSNAKRLSEEDLQIVEKRREAKGKGEKESYTHLNVEFHRIARKDRKSSSVMDAKKIEENNRMGKTRNLFKKIRDTKGTSHAKMGTIKERNGKDLTQAEVDVFLKFSCFFYNPTDVGNLISGSSAFSKCSLNIWEFSVLMLLKWRIFSVMLLACEMSVIVR